MPLESAATKLTQQLHKNAQLLRTTVIQLPPPPVPQPPMLLLLLQLLGFATAVGVHASQASPGSRSSRSSSDALADVRRAYAAEICWNFSVESSLLLFLSGCLHGHERTHFWSGCLHCLADTVTKDECRLCLYLRMNYSTAGGSVHMKREAFANGAHCWCKAWLMSGLWRPCMTLVNVS